jgi:hypothetical protein
MNQIRLAVFAVVIIVSTQIPTMAMAMAAEGIGTIVPLSNETLGDLRGGYIGVTDATSSLSAEVHHALSGPLAALIRSIRALGQLRGLH